MLWSDVITVWQAVNLIQVSNFLKSIVMQSSLLALDDSVLDIDQVDNLIKFCPTKEEIDLLKVNQSRNQEICFYFCHDIFTH